MDHDDRLIAAAEVVLSCTDLAGTLELFTGRLGFRVESVFPADAPRVVVIAAHGVRLRLESARGAAPAAPVPEARPALVVSRATEAEWHRGRAGMLYRDLIPGRVGGRYIGSAIRIPDGGPVADYVHFHRVRFQMIYCLRGSVRVVYEDQGPPFALEAGDCVLQPPGIRHRVLECSPGLEVLELTCPAEHETVADHELVLPTARVLRDRVFGGQRFVHDRAAAATWRPCALRGFEERDLGLAAASGGVGGGRVLRWEGGPCAAEPRAHDRDLSCFVVLAGAVALTTADGTSARLQQGDCCVVPSGLPFAFAAPEPGLQLLEVSAPAAGLVDDAAT